MSAALQAAKAYVARGWNPLPLPYKSKVPIGKGWPKRVIRAPDIPQYFNGRPQNVGVVLGPSSNGLTDIDLDCREAIELASQVLPPTGAIFGRHSAPASHWLYRSHLAAAPEQKATIQFQDPKLPKDNVMLLEVRIGGDKGAQTVFPGSVHESDEEIRWDKTGDPAEIADDVLPKQARLLASISLLARYWPGEGARHDAALSLGGFLARAGLPTPQIKYLVEAMAKTAKDPEHRDRRNTAEDAAQAFHAGKPARGFTTLRRTFGMEVARQVAEWLEYRGPDNDDDDDDKFGGTAAGQTASNGAAKGAGQSASPIGIKETLEVFNRWLALPDQTPILAALGTVAANLLPGDPVWLGLIGPPSSAKTEILNSTASLSNVAQAATMTVAGLLSGSPKKSHAKGAQGGLLRQIGGFGIIVLKDFGSILSMHPETKAEVLAALREIYDGAWTRHLGSDGGRTLSWQGKVGMLFAATGVINSHYAVIGSMGDRFLLSRLAPVGRGQFGRAMKHVGAGTKQMREELSQTVTRLFAGLKGEPCAITEEEIERIDDTIMLVVRLRGAVARDRQSREIEAVYGAEGTARIGLTLERLLAGLDTLGVDRATAMDVVVSVALDSVPPARRKAYDYLHALNGAAASTTDVAKAMELPTVTVRRVLEELVAYGLASCEPQGQGKPSLWRWMRV